MRRFLLAAALVAMTVAFMSFGVLHEGKPSDDSFPSVKIGSQVWMSQNLDVTRFRNGDIIPEAKTVKEWQRAVKEGKPAWCYPNDKSKKGGKYGKLYNWYAVNDPRGLAPEGWHIPNYEEVKILRDQASGYGRGPQFKAREGWHMDCHSSYHGNNKTGFAALPAGFRELNGDFDDNREEMEDYKNRYACFWMADKDKEWGENRAMNFRLHACDDQFEIEYAYWGEGFSVRCIKN